ncbi:MAG: glycosyltransferase, partial [Leptolyngbyaceae cyanobacterium bins.59]|nr:glycosyltransferase [Leptolyngbyaceae cyanobacterium bins.59]
MSPDCVLDFTIAIPTYNSARRISAVIDRLKAQQGIEGIAWEILVVDNNSTDETAAVIQELQANWSASFPLRYHFEAEQGAAFARQKAIREARGVMVGFLDDDNLPAPDWLASAHRFAKEYPQAGAYGGPIHGQFETEPPPGFEKIQVFLAIRD